jgi:hypothetical protein
MGPSRSELLRERAVADLSCPFEKVAVKVTRPMSWSNVIEAWAACGCNKTANYRYIPQANPSPPPNTIVDGEAQCAP